MRKWLPGLRGSKLWLNTVNEFDLAENQRVGGCQVDPGSLGLFGCVCCPACALCIYLFDSGVQQSK